MARREITQRTLTRAKRIKELYESAPVATVKEWAEWLGVSYGTLAPIVSPKGPHSNIGDGFLERIAQMHNLPLSHFDEEKEPIAYNVTIEQPASEMVTVTFSGANMNLRRSISEDMAWQFIELMAKERE